MKYSEINRFQKLAGLLIKESIELPADQENMVRFGNEKHLPHREEQEYCTECDSEECGCHDSSMSEDHEVSMAQASLEQIRKSAEELMAKLGEHEADIPAWIQDHIAKAQNYIEQANDNFYFNDENY